MYALRSLASKMSEKSNGKTRSLQAFHLQTDEDTNTHEKGLKAEVSIRPE